MAHPRRAALLCLAILLSPAAEASRLIASLDRRDVNAILHVTC